MSRSETVSSALVKFDYLPYTAPTSEVYSFIAISVQHGPTELDYRAQSLSASHPLKKSHVFPPRLSPWAPRNITANVHAIFRSSYFVTPSHCHRDLAIRGSLRHLWSPASFKAAYCYESRSYSTVAMSSYGPSWRSGRAWFQH